MHDLSLFCGLALAVPLPHAANSAVQTGPASADLVVFNAKVYTVDSSQPKAEAFAVKKRRFISGSSEGIKSLTGSGTERFDARQMTIVPGFIDCHNHVPGDTLLYEGCAELLGGQVYTNKNRVTKKVVDTKIEVR